MRSSVLATALGIAACSAITAPAGAQGPPTVVKDINEEVVRYGVQPWDIAAAGGMAFFRGCADDGLTGCELWRSDGTEAGTVLVKDIEMGDSLPSNWTGTDVGGTLFFAAEDVTHGLELWRSDGTRPVPSL